MKRYVITLGSLVVSLVLVACATPAASPTAAPKTPAAATTAPSGATAPATGAATVVAPTKPAALKVGQNPTLNQFITDDQGRTLYLFTQDTSSASTCYDACAQKWPPLLTQGAATQTGLNASLLGTSQRREGTAQVTYNGHPLYYYATDQKAGDTTGQGVGSVWYVVSPAGDAIK